MKKRNKNIDILKGIGIILIVLGHVNSPFTSYVYLFHVILFIIASGYMWNKNNIKSIKDYIKYLINKIKKLYIPYVICNLFGIILNIIFCKLPITYVYDCMDKGYILTKAKGILKFTEVTGEFGATWFLSLLFFVSCIYTFNELVLNKYFNKNKKIMKLFIAVIYYILGVFVLKNKIDLRYVYSQTLICYSFFEIGNQFSYYKKITNKTKSLFIFILSSILLIILNKYGKIELSQFVITDGIFLLLCSVIGWLMVYELSYLIISYKKISNIFSYIGQKTMPILIFHFISFNILSFILDLLILNERSTEYYNNKYIFILYVLVGITLPLIIKYLFSKIKRRRL